jgi:hypothetical protein
MQHTGRDRADPTPSTFEEVHLHKVEVAHALKRSAFHFEEDMVGGELLAPGDLGFLRQPDAEDLLGRFEAPAGVR